MYQYIKTISPRGLEGKEITVEIDSNRSLPTIEIIGLPDNAIKESRERLRASYRACGIEIPPRKFVINLAPSDVRKSGTLFDLAIAVALLCCIADEARKHREECDQGLFFWELGLDGSVRKVQGILPAMIAGIRRWHRIFFIPADNVHEVRYVRDVIVYPVSHFRDMVAYIIEETDMIAMEPHEIEQHERSLWSRSVLESIQGHGYAKRVLAIGVSGFHAMLMVWPPGVGKTLLAKWIPELLPAMSFEDMMEVNQLYSLVGKLDDAGWFIHQRPFREVHHTASKASIIGWGQQVLPWEISLAHKGVLFLDELPEFPRDVLDTLRQPLEEKKIHISRVSGHIQYPAHFLFLAAMNPCVCGYYGDRERACRCSVAAVKKYQQRVSGPLLDRIDIIVSLKREGVWGVLGGVSQEESTSTIREKIACAWEMQKKRYAGSGYYANADVGVADIWKYIPLDDECRSLLNHAKEKLQLSLRVIHKTMKIARTIADYMGSETVMKEHILEALQYRMQEWVAKE
jgi:magnesium chelatase family protein